MKPYPRGRQGLLKPELQRDSMHQDIQDRREDLNRPGKDTRPRQAAGSTEMVPWEREGDAVASELSAIYL